MFKCIVVLFSIIDNEYKYLAVKNDNLDYSLLRIENEKELEISELEEILYKEVGVKCTINKIINKQIFSLKNNNEIIYYVGELDTNIIHNDKMELFDYKDIKSNLINPNEKELIRLTNVGITYYMISDIYRQHLSSKYLDINRLPYLELTKKADKEVKKYIKQYKDSDLYEYIYKLAKIIRYFYNSTNHIEDYQHNDKKYLRELLFHTTLWFPTYLDVLEAREKRAKSFAQH